VKLSLLLILLLTLNACGVDPDSDSRHDSIEQSKDSLRAEADRKDRQKQCCFQSTGDFDTFFTDTLGEFGKQRSEVELLCNNDTLAHNTSLIYYTDDNGHLLTLRITEYCTSPSMLAADYSLKYEMRKSTAEFNEFDVPPTHHGFSTYDPKQSVAYLLVEVDERFLLEITDQVCSNTNKVLALYAALPLDELAVFGR
jgi:hypothetical protein